MGPLRVDFPTIYSSICPSPSAQEETLLSKQPMYPSDSTQLVFLMNNLDKDFINRAKLRYNPLEPPSNQIAQISSPLPYITTHSRVSLFWGTAPLISNIKAPPSKLN